MNRENTPIEGEVVDGQGSLGGRMAGGTLLGGMLAGLLVFMLAAPAIYLLAIKLLWAWTIPDLFQGAVEQGLVARSIGWFTALKLALILSLVTWMARGSRSS